MMTTTQTVHTPPLGRSRPRRGRAMRRTGGLLSTLALVTLGLAGGLWLGSPASAAAPPIQVKMAGDTDFSTVASTPLLNMTDLVPGGSVSGTMQVRDASGNGGDSGLADTISLQMVNVTIADGPVGGPTRAGSGQALAKALGLTVHVAANGTSAGAAETVASLESSVTLASGLHDGDVLEVTMTATLPNRDPVLDNAFQYGRITFDLQLELTSAAVNPGGGTGGAGTGGGADGGAGPGIQQPGNVAENAGGGSHIQVLGTESVVAGPAGGAAGAPGKAGILVLGEHGGSLSYTGAPIIAMLAAGGAALLLGLVLLLAARRRGKRLVR
ncbi:MAG: hypothetical protein BGO26_07275 [Actinobacteria bacterium 69-20]|nr:hypothetical protein [Actinomycetota bacterium]OJV30161.1 MAG: hypothetical protein BGO26_07275 [Actinobacteria bacterium 69-20]